MGRLGVTGTLFCLDSGRQIASVGYTAASDHLAEDTTRERLIAARSELCGRQQSISGAPKRKVAFTARSFRLRISFKKYSPRILSSWLAF